MGLKDALSGLVSGNEGNAQGIAERQQALKDIGSGALTNKPAATPSPKTATPAKAAPASNTKPARYGDRPGEKRLNIGPDGEVLGSFKKGGKVKKTGNYKLHKGERVLNPKQTKKAEKGGLMKALKKG